MRKEFIERADISYLLIEMQQANALIPLLLRKVLMQLLPRVQMYFVDR